MIEVEIEKLDYVETDYNELNNKPIINGIVIEANKLAEEYGLQPLDENYVHTDNNYTNSEKSKLSNLSNYDDSELKKTYEGINVKIETIEDKLTGFLTKEEINYILNDYSLKSELKTKTSELVNDSGFVSLSEENQRKLISLLNSLVIKSDSEIEFVGIVSARGFNDYD